MKLIELDARRWRSVDDVCSAILAALGAPEWHGKNLDALWETITEAVPCDRDTPETLINAVQPPFQIVVTGSAAASGEVQKFLAKLRQLFTEANAEYKSEAPMIGFVIANGNKAVKQHDEKSI